MLPSGVQQCDENSSKNYAAEVLRSIEDFYKNNQFSDITLVTKDGQRFPAHRNVLSATAEYFFRMFTSGMRESIEEEVSVEVDATTIDLLLQYFYSGHIKLQEDNVQSLLSAARYLLVSEVVDKCCNFLINHLNPSNCLGMEELAETFQLDTLLVRSGDYALYNFMKVVDYEEFLNLKEDKLANMFRSDNLNVFSEENVFDALKLWLDHDKCRREKFLPMLLGLVRLPLLRREFIWDHVRVVSNLTECVELAEEAYLWDVNPEILERVPEHRMQPRKSTTNCLLVIGESNGKFNIERFCPILQKCTYVEKCMSYETPFFRYRFGVGYFNNQLIIFGGCDEHGSTNTVDCFDWKTMTWSSLESMNSRRNNAGIAVLNGLIYAVGGANDMDYLNTVERYDPSSNEWDYVEPMLVNRWAAGVVAFNGCLYVVGGKNRWALNSVECFDPTSNSWILRAPMNQVRFGVSVVVLDGFLYALGGTNGKRSLKSVEQYNPIKNKWKRVASLDQARQYIGNALNDKKLLAIGGYRKGNFVDTVMQYNVEENNWTPEHDINLTQMSLTKVTIKRDVPNIVFAIKEGTSNVRFTGDDN